MIHYQNQPERLMNQVHLLLRILLSIGVCLTCSAAHGQKQSAAIQAALIYQFTRYIEWHAPRIPGNKMTINVLAEPNLVDELRSVFKEKESGGDIEIVSDEALTNAQIFVLGNFETSRTDFAKNLLEANCQCLTIGLHGYPGEAIINLYIAGGQFQFDVDKILADKQRLYISSKILKLARRVKDRT